MADIKRITCVASAIILLSGFIQVATAQDVPKLDIPRMKYIEIFLDKLSGNDASTIEHNRFHDEIVLELLIQISRLDDNQCTLTAASEYWGYFKYSINLLREKLGYREGAYPPMDMWLTAQTTGAVYQRGCASADVQLILENSVQYALGQQQPVPYELAEGKTVSKLSYPFIDYYCRSPGRYDPECSNLIGFMKGRPEPSCSDGLRIPAAPEPPKVVWCVYEMPISSDTRRNFNKAFTYWYQRVPDNLDSLHVHGVDQFSSIAPVAVEACPKDHRAAASLSGDRYGTPITRLPGVITGMPEPSSSVRNPRCEEVRAAKPDVTTENLQEAEGRRGTQEAPAITIEEAEGTTGLAANFAGEYQVTPSGLRYGVLQMGNGAKPTATNTVWIHYRGSLLDGTEFESSYARNQPLSISLNRAIAGWTEGLQLMPVGSKFIFKIPPDLAYGKQGAGPIPPNSTLIFEMELLAIEK
jgi:FKBP-type peptidyl-prolyl cis-trans isomerase